MPCTDTGNILSRFWLTVIFTTALCVSSAKTGSPFSWDHVYVCSNVPPPVFKSYAACPDANSSFVLLPAEDDGTCPPFRLLVSR